MRGRFGAEKKLLEKLAHHRAFVFRRIRLFLLRFRRVRIFGGSAGVKVLLSSCDGRAFRELCCFGNIYDAKVYRVAPCAVGTRIYAAFL